MKENGILDWVQNWYQSHCDGDWEHVNGIEITTLDNPGWGIKIDLEGTELEGLEIEYELHEKSEGDWYAIKAGDNSFEGHGDPMKLGFLLHKFREIVESRNK